MSVNDETQPFEHFPNILSAFSLMLKCRKKSVKQSFAKTYK